MSPSKYGRADNNDDMICMGTYQSKNKQYFTSNLAQNTFGGLPVLPINTLINAHAINQQ